MFRPLYLEILLTENKDIFNSVYKQNSDLVSLLIKEVIVIDLIQNYVEGVVFTSDEIQRSIYDYLMLDHQKIPTVLLECPPSTPKKNRLKTLLNNILSSNLQNATGLGNRMEVKITKNEEGHYEFCANKNLVRYFNGKPTNNIVNDLQFIAQYHYLSNFFQIIHFETPSSIHIPGLKCGVCQNTQGIVIQFKKTPSIADLSTFTPMNTRHICKYCLEKELKKVIYDV